MSNLNDFVQETRTREAQEIIDRALSTVREHLGMEIAYLSEFVDGRSIFRAVDAPGLEHLVKSGDSFDLNDVYCQHILDGRLPELIPDTGAEAQCRAMPITRDVPIGSHVSVPIRRGDGSVYGMFCCLSPRPNPSLNQRDLSVMKMFADLAGEQVRTAVAQREAQSRMASLIEAALADRSFDMHFQPICELETGEPSGFEALCRFDTTPYRSPDKWFADAEAVGRGVDLELAAIEAALKALEVLPASIYLSVNASPATVASGRLDTVFDGHPLERIVLEITEHSDVGDDTALMEQIRLWRFRGVLIAIDDAGAGYSGLQQIVRLSPDIIKLDMSLTTGVDTDTARRSLAAAMVHFARETGSKIVAEGIETEAERATLMDLGVHRGQGWLLGKPQPLRAALDLCQPRKPALRA